MKNKFLLLIFATLLFVQCSVPAEASVREPSVNVVAGYYFDDILYTFVEKNTSKANSKMSFNMEVNNNSVGVDYLNNNVAKSTKVSYMLLVDLSTSMSSQRSKVNAFAQSLMEAEKAKVKFSISSFGEKFQVNSQNLTTVDSLTEELNKLQFNQNATDICDGVNKALNFLTKNNREPGEFVNLVLITDGKPYLSNTIENQQEVIQSSAKKTKKHLSNTSDVVVHSISFGEWENTTFEAVSSGTGKHTIAYTIDEIKSFAEQTANYSDNLYPLSYAVNISSNIKYFDAQLSIVFKGGNRVEAVKEKSIRNLDYIQIKKPSETEPETEPVAKSKKKKNAVIEKEAPTVQQDTETTANASDNSNIEIKDNEPFKVDSDFIKLGIIIGISAVAVLSVVFAVIIVKKSKNKRKALSGASHRINMVLEDISGNCKNKTSDLVFCGELIIGRNSSCDIVVKDKAVAPRNSRIFIKDNTIYIENIGENTSTAVGGMKIYSPNKLRSGDEITVGKSLFRLRF
ncbi:MAG: FHA domain-containing protein [Ruminococcus sp.]